MKIGLKIFVVFFITCVSCELIIRWSGVFNTYMERIGGDYSTYYNQVYPTWCWTYTPGKIFNMRHGEFNYVYKTNSLGIREREFPKEKDDSVTRIITIGDSFTDGVGAPYDSSY